jgi:hypothetical protein
MAGATFPSVATRPAGLTDDPRAIPLPRWEKRGRIFSREDGGFFKSHATRPIPYRLADGRLRIFFSSRCGDDMPHPAFIDVDPADPARVLAVAETPLLPLGRPGTFDDSGITPVSILRSPDGDLM